MRRKNQKYVEQESIVDESTIVVFGKDTRLTCVYSNGTAYIIDGDITISSDHIMGIKSIKMSVLPVHMQKDDARELIMGVVKDILFGNADNSSSD